MTAVRRCPRCGKVKPAEQFYRRRRTRLSSYCRSCQRAAARLAGIRRRQDPAAAEQLRAVGLSGNKTASILDLASKTSDGTVPLERMEDLSDDEIVARLSAVRGIGRWTAEMFLIFHLLRPNVLPLDDVGLIKGISVNYFSGEPVSRAEAREVGDAWVPYRSVATWYIWRSLDPMAVSY